MKYAASYIVLTAPLTIASQQLSMAADMLITLPAPVQTTKAQIEINGSHLP